jgi:hypothetical protein
MKPEGINPYLFVLFRWKKIFEKDKLIKSIVPLSIFKRQRRWMFDTSLKELYKCDLRLAKCIHSGV